MQASGSKLTQRINQGWALFISCILLLNTINPASAQYNNNAWLQQQRMQQAQRAAEQARQAQESARRAQQQQQMQRQQQMQAQQQRQMQQQQQAANQARRAQDAASQARRSAIPANQNGYGKPANQNAYSTRPNQATMPSAPTTAIRGASDRNVSAKEQRGFVSSAGVSKLTRPLTPGEIKKGFTGKVLGDGRPLIKFQGRVFAVPASSLSGLVRKPANQNVAPTKFTLVQRQQVSTRIASLISGKPRPAAAGGSGPKCPPKCDDTKGAAAGGTQPPVRSGAGGPPLVVGGIAANDNVRGLLQAARATGVSSTILGRVRDLGWGKRPAPSTYLSENYIKNHLDTFRSQGAIRITTKSDITNNGGMLGQPKGGFVMAKSDFDRLVAETGGSKREIERALGLEAGRLDNGETVIAWVKPENVKGLRIPDGNEGTKATGANDHWVPGGLTAGGYREAVIDFDEVKEYNPIKIGS